MSKDFTNEVKEHTQDLDFEKNKYQVTLETSKGNITMDLFPEVAPNHCRNIIGLSRAGFYDNLNFHRVIDGFVVQGGCPQGNGTGGPGFHVGQEFNDMPHQLGVLSMARAQDPNSAGSQFFICLGDVPSLDGQYTVFGKTVDEDSQNVVREIGKVDTDRQDRPLEEVKINKSIVTEQPR